MFIICVIASLLYKYTQNKGIGQVKMQNGIYVNKLKSILSWLSNRFAWYLLILPILSSYLVYWASSRDILGFSDQSAFKDLMEVVHPLLLTGFLLVSWQSYRITRDTSYCFLGVLSCFVLNRELMGQGSSFILYIGLLILFRYAVHHPEKLTSLSSSRWATSFLFMCFVCYATSQMLDRGLIKRIGWLILWDSTWKIPYSSNFEEALEALGGFFLLLTPYAVHRRFK